MRMYRVYSSNYQELIYQEYNSSSHKFDLINDTASSVIFEKTNNINVGDLLVIDMKYIYMIVNIDNQTNEIMFKSILEYLNNDFIVENKNINLYDLLINYVIDYTADLNYSMSFFDIDKEISKYQVVFENPLTSSSSTETNIYNIKQLLINTLISKRLTFEVINNLVDKRIKLSIIPQQQRQDISLNELICANLEIPQKVSNDNSLELKRVIYKPDNETIASQVKKNYFLTKDNEVTEQFDNLERVLPAKYTAIDESYSQSTDENDNVVDPEVLSMKEVAENKLLDTSQYYINFELYNNRKYYTDFQPLIGDLVKIYYNNNAFVTAITAIEYKSLSTVYTCGFDRQSLIYKIKKGGK